MKCIRGNDGALQQLLAASQQLLTNWAKINSFPTVSSADKTSERWAAGEVCAGRSPQCPRDPGVHVQTVEPTGTIQTLKRLKYIFIFPCYN